jgi:MoxR-like ATPase
MKALSREHLPLASLLHAYLGQGLPGAAELSRPPGVGPRFAAILSATARFLYPEFVDGASDAESCAALVRFHEACVRPPLHADSLRRRAGVVRLALAYLLRGKDSWPEKADNCLRPGGAYHAAGLGPQFWSALFQAARPARNPGWTPATLEGLRRLGLDSWAVGASPGAVYAGLLSAYEQIQEWEPALTAVQVDHFLSLVAAMRGRNLVRTPAGEEADSFEKAVLRERARVSLRERLKERGEAIARAQEQLEAGLAQHNGKAIGDALAAADPAGSARAPLDWAAKSEELTLWVGRLWEADEPAGVLSAFWQADPVPGAGQWLPAAVLHLRDPQRFFPWSEDVRRGYATLDDAADAATAPVERYRLFNEGVAWLRERYRVHALEVPAVLEALAPPDASAGGARRTEFGGFCDDTFHFLSELGHNNRRDWMERQRDRYRFAVRRPLVELCRALAERYVGPVLRGVHGWDLDTEARSGRALTSVCKNAFGRTQPYNTTLWIAFCRRDESGRRGGAQFFVRLDAAGLRFGLRLGRKARDAVTTFRQNVRCHTDLLFRALRDGGALADCRFGSADSSEPPREVSTPGDLRDWAAGRSFEIARTLPAGSPLLAEEELVGEILLTFDRLAPAYACAAEADALPFLSKRVGGPEEGERYGEADFRRATYLGDDWLRRARSLLDLKRQLILQGVPGTGKTHVARHLARLLTGGRDEAVRLVQFHPAYSYEEFVEGIKVRSVEVEGRHDVTYPVEDGLLCAFAAEAARRPSEPHVLVIDEINRGNLPRVFGELLYLLEYRDQAVGLPYSRRGFRLPANLYLIATMNAADRSAAHLDQALRRRFSFLEMPPDAALLAAWLAAHPPAAGPAFAGRVVALFERLNARLRADLGPQGQVGHSYFMVDDLDETRLRVVWDHHVRPLLEGHFAGQPGRLGAYDLERLWEGDLRRPDRRKRRAAGAAG